MSAVSGRLWACLSCASTRPCLHFPAFAPSLPVGMAKLFKRHGSKNWWVEYHRRGKRCQKSTGLSYEVSADTRKAHELCAKLTLEELQHEGTADQSRWELWVPELFRVRYANQPATKSRYETTWRTIQVFLDKHGIESPAELTYEHVLHFVEWRQQPGTKGVYAVCRNTAIMEAKIWGIIIQEAVRRKFILVNPARGLGLTRDKPKEKPEITPEEEALIRLKLKAQPEWMEIAFNIAMATGCRLRETAIDFRDVDFELKLLHLRTKGGRLHTMPLPPSLEPLLRELKARGLKKTLTLPVQPSKEFWRFFNHIGLGHLCFHCTRVTVVTRLARQGVQERFAMKYVGHASATVHRIYQRLQVDDVRCCIEALERANRGVPVQPGPASDGAGSSEA